MQSPTQPIMVLYSGLVEYEKQLDREQRKNWNVGLGIAGAASVDNPRAAIAACCMKVLGYAMAQEIIAALKRKLHTTMREGIRKLAEAEAAAEKRKKKPAKSIPKKR